MKKCKQFIKKWYPFLIVIGMIFGPIVYHVVAVQVEIHNLVYSQELKDQLDSYFTQKMSMPSHQKGLYNLMQLTRKKWNVIPWAV